MARGAPLGVVDDDSPLDGPEINVGARIGWLLRMTRQSTPGGPPPLEVMAAKLDTSPAQLHRLETGQLRDGRLIDGYERLLLRPHGSLRAPIDVVCRTFPSSPSDRDPGPFAASVAEMTAQTEAVSAGVVDGGSWLRWARSLSQSGAIGMPSGLAAELVGRLVSELNRAVGVGYPRRYEALAQLRCGPYGAIVLDVARQAATDPHVQVLFDMMSAVGESATPDAVAWCVDLLDSDRSRLVVGAALALENMGLVEEDPAERPLDRLRTTRTGHHRAGRTAGPAHARAPAVRHRRQPVREPRRDVVPAARRPRRAGRGRRRAPRGAGGGARRPGRARTRGAPAGRDDARRDAAPGPHLAAQSGRLGPDRALMLAGASGTPVADQVLRSALSDGPASRHAALYAIGMTGGPLLESLTTDSDDEVAGGARWWMRHGSRVVDVEAP